METISDNFKVQTDVFEGPLELLLNLIEKRKLFINDISLASVADDYMEHIKEMEGFPMGDVANFILIASTLVLIKSKSLLPQFTLTEEEEGDIEKLEHRLKMYKQMQMLSTHTKTRFAKNIIFPKQQTKIKKVVFAPGKDISIQNLVFSMNNILGRLPKIKKIPKAVVKKIISLDEVMSNLKDRIKSSIQLSFREFSKRDKSEKIDVVVHFLAILEMVKQGIVVVKQNKAFADMSIEDNSDPDTPHYG